MTGSEVNDGAEKDISARFYIVNQCSILLLSAIAWLTSDPVISYMIPGSEDMNLNMNLDQKSYH